MESAKKKPQKNGCPGSVSSPAVLIAVFVVAAKPGSHDLIVIRRGDFEDLVGKAEKIQKIQFS